MIASSIIDTKALWQTMWTSAVSGVLVCVIFSVAVLGATRSSDTRQEGRPVASTIYATLAVVCALAALALAVYGIVLIAHR
jgi:uncharacterized membrane protein